ncbi:hypothetical protein GCM10022224_043470 [Nonomuraea antimicrobica]|uniref:Transposase IS30-like HTH domain-containing protein n=1 Tax=Nonomuraea antimicrobica TaxID=561173 RepID=A0ABP7C1I7_9ACTN
MKDGHHSPGKGPKPKPPIHHEQAGHPADLEGSPFRSSRYLNENERIHIADWIREGASIRAVAAELGRSPSTVSREIRRNRRPMPKVGWTYRSFHAQRRAERRRARPKHWPFPLLRVPGPETNPRREKPSRLESFLSSLVVPCSRSLAR